MVSNKSRFCELVIPDPKPEWIPNQHQAQILEELFTGGEVNPSLTDIKQITIKLQKLSDEVDDADVYKWFQIQKFRLKHKICDAKQNRQGCSDLEDVEDRVFKKWIFKSIYN